MQSYRKAAFITLTYRDDQLMIRNGVANLVPSDLRKYFKRLRRNLERSPEPLRGTKISYYACGEYGENPNATNRPHYHAIIFGLGCDDKGILSESWGMGTVHVGTVTPDSVRYVAQYIDKKLLGTSAYFSNRENCFQVSSQGIGVDWVKGQLERVLYEASVRFRGREFPLPRRYRKEVAKLFPDAASGLEQRILDSAIDSEFEMIWELAPEFGGLQYADLTDDQRCTLAKRIHFSGSANEADLLAGLKFKASRSKV